MPSSATLHNTLDCNEEARILSLAEQIIVKRFNERLKPFTIGIMSHRYCSEADRCMEIKCYCNDITRKYNEFNLADYYDHPAALLGADSPYHIIISSSDPRRKDIYIVLSFMSKPFILPKNSEEQVIEIRLNGRSDLPRLETCRIFKQGPKVRFYNFKNRPITPNMLCLEYKQLGKPLPPCNAVEQHLPRKRYVLYPDGHFNCFELTETQACRHDSSSLMDITYNTNYFKGFDPAKELARKDWRARFCDYCDHCLTSSRGTIWCDLKLNGWTAHKTFDRTKGPACAKFVWRYSSAAVDWVGDDIKPKEGIDYRIWKNPLFKK